MQITVLGTQLYKRSCSSCLVGNALDETSLNKLMATQRIIISA